MPPLKLEVFEVAHPLLSGQTVVLDAAAIEDVRLQAYESGYSAGWEDAISAGRDDQNRIGTELANNLQKLAFTFHEARNHILQSVKPLVVQLSTRLLPEVAHKVLAPVLHDTLMPLIDSLANEPIHIVLNPISRPAVEHLLEKVAGVPLTIEEEPTLGEGQAYLRFGEVEHHIDLDQAVADIIRATQDFFEYAYKEPENG